jgi:hypothetical protein
MPYSVDVSPSEILMLVKEQKLPQGIVEKQMNLMGPDPSYCPAWRRRIERACVFLSGHYWLEVIG